MSTEQTPEAQAIARDRLAAIVMHRINTTPLTPTGRAWHARSVERDIAAYLALTAAIDRRGAVLTPRGPR